jgi:hypothetical protein
MTRTIKLSVPSPCKQKWETFRQAEAGGFCSSCNKTVLDFTRMNDEEVLAWFEHAKGNTCGRFRPRQLKTYASPDMPRIYVGFPLFRAALAFVVLTLISNTGYATPRFLPAATEIVEDCREKISVISSPRQVVRGVVVDKYDGVPLPGIQVIVKGNINNATTTDAEGRFEIWDVEATDILTFSFIGYRTEELAVTDIHGKIEIQMEVEVMFLGEVLVEPGHTPAPKQKFWSRIFHGHNH